MDRSNLLATDIEFLDDLLQMHTGYVLDFTGRTFTQFFADLGIDIDAPRYTRRGRSKAKRLRCFVQTANRSAVTRVLDALWRHCASRGLTPDASEAAAAAQRRLQDLLARLQLDSPDAKGAGDAACLPSVLERLNASTPAQDSAGTQAPASPESSAGSAILELRATTDQVSERGG